MIGSERVAYFVGVLFHERSDCQLERVGRLLTPVAGKYLGPVLELMGVLLLASASRHRA
jgi:hypothetical protein